MGNVRPVLWRTVGSMRVGEIVKDELYLLTDPCDDPEMWLFEGTENAAIERAKVLLGSGVESVLDRANNR